MQVDLDIKKLSNNSVLYRENGKIVCVPKEEFLKEQTAEISSLTFKIEKLESLFNKLQKTIVEEILDFKNEMSKKDAVYKKTLLAILETLKGEEDEKDN